MALQKPKTKSPLEEWAQNLGDGVMRWLIGLTRNWSRRPEIFQNNYNLGREYLKSGKASDAVLRFKITSWMEPSRADIWYLLGRSYLADGEPAAAVASLKKALALKPGYEEAGYMLAMAGGVPEGQLPGTMPVELAKEFFEDAAADYSREQVEGYQYRGHELLAGAVKEVLVPERKDYVVLELGVGSGLMGPLVREFSAQLIGVDFSPAMLAEAEKRQDADGRKTYDTLINREIHEFLPGVADHAFDVVLAAGTLSYIGESAGIFAQVARVLKPGGVFAFTADEMEGRGFRLDTSAGLFRFSKAYLEGLAARNGFAALKFEEAETYPGYKAWLCIFARHREGA